MLWSAHANKRTAISMHEAAALIEPAEPYLPDEATVEVTAEAAFGRPVFLKALIERGWDFVVRARTRYKVHLLAGDPPGGLLAEGLVDERGYFRLGELARGLAPGAYRAYGRVAFTEKWKLEGVSVSAYWKRGKEVPWILLHSGWRVRSGPTAVGCGPRSSTPT